MKNFVRLAAFMVCLVGIHSEALPQITITYDDLAAVNSVGNVLVDRYDTTTKLVDIGSPGETSWDFSAIHTDLSKEYNIYEEEGEVVGQQYPTDTGPIDILAISKDKKRLLVVELKKGRASDVVVGQILRYMGYAQEELAEEGQTVKGVIIALEDDQRIRRALAVVPSIDFYRYQVSFKLVKA